MNVCLSCLSLYISVNKMVEGHENRPRKGILPRLRTKFGECAFSHAGPATWNSLPEDIRANQDSEPFRKQLKTYFFTLAFNVH